MEPGEQRQKIQEASGPGLCLSQIVALSLAVPRACGDGHCGDLSGETQLLPSGPLGHLQPQTWGAVLIKSQLFAGYFKHAVALY